LLIYSQINALWRNHVLGYGGRPGTIGLFGCYITVCAMIANAAGVRCNPIGFNDLATKRRVFQMDPTGTYDFLPDNALDRVFPGSFKTYAYPGFRADLIAKALPSKYSFAYVHIKGWSPLWGMNILTHFALMWSASQIADPQGGVVRNLIAAYGKGTVDRTYIVTYIPPAPVVVVPPAPAPGPIPLPPAPPVVPPLPAPLPPDPLPPVAPPTPPPADLSVTFWQWLYSVIAAYFHDPSRGT
jgi:hypothetical protein